MLFYLTIIIRHGNFGINNNILHLNSLKRRIGSYNTSQAANRLDSSTFNNQMKN